eukprot:11059304-Alexandrium_andersonii.AAC.1
MEVCVGVDGKEKGMGVFVFVEEVGDVSPPSMLVSLAVAGGWGVSRSDAEVAKRSVYRQCNDGGAGVDYGYVVGGESCGGRFVCACAVVLDGLGDPNLATIVSFVVPALSLIHI